MEKRNYFDFIKNTNASNVLKLDILNNVAMHAYMIVASDDITANMFAEYFAFTLICKNSCADLTCSSCVKALSSSNLDLKVYPKNNKTIIVEDIEDIINTSLEKPIENENKVYLLKDFSYANIASQNKLLKILEEPPQNTYFVLSVSNTQSVLQTILSRCKVVTADAFKKEDIYAFLLNNNIENNKAELVSNFCLNSLGTAISLANMDNFNEMILAVEYLFNNCNSTKDMLNTVSLIQPFSDNLALFFNVVEIYLYSLLQSKNSSVSFDDKFNNIKDKFSYLSIDAIEKIIIDSRQKILFNCNTSAVIDMFVLKFLEEKYKWK